MANISETGHAKNVALFEELISFVSGFGEAYTLYGPESQKCCRYWS